MKKITYCEARSALIIERLSKYFRVLKGWKIRVSKSDQHKARCWISNKRKLATIYLWHGRAPKDFELHEILHCALEALVRLDRRSPKEAIALEETLVQDICHLVFPEVTIQIPKRSGRSRRR